MRIALLLFTNVLMVTGWTFICFKMGWQQPVGALGSVAIGGLLVSIFVSGKA